MSAYDLPPEILLRILSYLPQESLTSASRTCKVIYTLSQDKSLYRHLILTDISLRDALPRRILLNLPYTHTLVLTNQMLSPYVARTILGGLSHSRTLNYLDLTSVHQFPPSQLSSLFSKLEPSCGLHTVILDSTRISNEPLIQLVVRHGRSLRHLSVEFAEITGVVVDAISDFCYEGLEYLSLAGCFQIGPKPLERFLRCLPPNLKKLDIRYSWDFDVEFLQDGTGNLEELDVRGCEITVEDVQKLRMYAGPTTRILETANDEKAVALGGWAGLVRSLDCEVPVK